MCFIFVVMTEFMYLIIQSYINSMNVNIILFSAHYTSVGPTGSSSELGLENTFEALNQNVNFFTQSNWTLPINAAPNAEFLSDCHLQSLEW